jgi:hypothetical protein
VSGGVTLGASFLHSVLVLLVLLGHVTLCWGVSEMVDMLCDGRGGNYHIGGNMEQRGLF